MPICGRDVALGRWRRWGFSKYGELHEREDRDDDQDQNGPGERRQASDDRNRLPQRQSFIRCS